MAPTHEQIAELAYLLYVEEGRPEGRADAHWRRAVEILRNAPGTGLPSDPHSGPEAVHQQMQVAVDGRNDQGVAEVILEVVQAVRGVEQAQIIEGGRFVQISFDARRTNPAAIFDAIEARRRREEIPEPSFEHGAT